MRPSQKSAERFADVYFIYHPDDIEFVRRAAAQLAASGSDSAFSEAIAGKTPLDWAELKGELLRAHTAAVALSPSSAASQLCNELIQLAINNGKRLVTLIRDENVEVEVHPAIAENPFVFFRESDDFVARIDELRGHLAVDAFVQLQTELLAAADRWQRGGRKADDKWPGERLDEARAWLAEAATKDAKPAPMLVEFVHGSRRVQGKGGRSRSRRLSLAALTLVAGAIAIAIAGALLDWRAGALAAAEATEAAETALAATNAAATADASNALRVIDDIAATADALRQTALAQASQATAQAAATRTAQALADARAAQARATQRYRAQRDADARRLLAEAEALLDAGDAGLALALAWAARDGLADPKPALRLLRRALTAVERATINDVGNALFQPTGGALVIVPRGREGLRLYSAESWSLERRVNDHDAPISAIAYSADGAVLATGAENGEVIVRASADAQPHSRIQTNQGAITAIALDAEPGRLFTAGRDPLLAAWDWSSGEKLASFATDDSPASIDRLLVTHDGALVAGWAGDDDGITPRRWSSDSLEIIPSQADFPLFSGGMRIGYSIDEATDALVFWDLAADAALSRVDDFAGADLRFAAFHEDRALLGSSADADDALVLLVDLAEGRVIRRLDDERAGEITSAIFLDDWSAVAATDSGELILWSLESGSAMRVFADDLGALERLAYHSASATIAALESSGKLRLWRIDNSGSRARMTRLDADAQASLSPGGQTVLARDDGAVLRDNRSGETRLELGAGAIVRGGAFFAWIGAEEIAVYEAEAGLEVHRWRGNWQNASPLSLSPGGTSLLLRAGADLHLLRAGADEPLRLSDEAPHAALFHEAGERILTLHPSRAILWAGESGTAIGAFPLGDTDSAELHAAFAATGDALHFFARLEDGIASQTTVDLGDFSATRRVFLDVERGEFSADGAYLLLARTEGDALVIDAGDGGVQRRVEAGIAAPGKLAYSPASDRLYVADGRDLEVWDAADSLLEARLAHPGPVVDFSHSADDRWILSEDAAGGQRLWRLESAEETIARIEALDLPRDLTCAERERFGIDPPCA